jgi:hypothetical protein
MDALYGPLKSATYARGEKVVQAKLKQRGLARKNGERLQSAVLNLDFSNLPTIVRTLTSAIYPPSSMAHPMTRHETGLSTHILQKTRYYGPGGR